ncbi:MAG TPA: nitroreductase family protein [Candidatus Dormibacteraeota bacterium]
MPTHIFEAVRTLLAVREYQDREVPGEIVERVVEAAQLTASASNRQPWHFVVVRDRALLRELGGLVRTGPYIASAAFAVVCAYEAETGARGVSDVSRAIQDMMLVAWEEGVGSNWTGFDGLTDVRERMGLPEIYNVVAVLPFGYPARKIGKGKKNRKPVEEVVSAERFGQPFRP